MSTLIKIKPEILAKIRDKHAVDIEEVYEVFEGRFILTRVRGNRYRAIGKTATGRFLTIFMDKIGKDFEIEQQEIQQTLRKGFIERK